MTRPGYPRKQGLYDPRYEHDACGIGFVVNIKGEKSHEIVQQALTVLQNLDHRGACGCEDNTGDGAGILLQIPHAFLQHACDGIGLQLPKPGHYGVGMVFLPPDREQRHHCEQCFEAIVRQAGQQVLGRRSVPTDSLYLGETAKSREPVIRQVFIKRSPDLTEDVAFERKLYVIRRQAENAMRYAGVPGGDYFYLSSLSYKTIVYKGMLTPRQVLTFYPDLTDPLVETALAVIHSRFSTNTFPSWERSHPYRYLIHNGEINTLRGNENWMHARQAMLASDLFGDDLRKVFPIIQEDGSDSAKFDNCRMFLVDTEEGRIISDEELKQTVARMRPYRQWLRDHLVDFETLPALPEEEPQGDHRVTLKRQQVFGYSFEDLRVNIGPMALTSIQPVGSMGTDTPLAVLSDKPQLLYNYFKQLFAQVTNPPIDPI